MPMSASAQSVDQSQVMDRMDKLERDLMLLQRQISRGETSSAPGGEDSGTISNPAQLEIRLSAIEEQLRDLRGSIEENENHIHKISDSFDKLQKDVDFRFSELANNSTSHSEVKQPVMSVQPMSGKAPFAPASASGSNTLNTGNTLNTASTQDNSKQADNETGDNAAPTNFASSREFYNYAFRLLNQTQYEESAAAFEGFTKKYPKDPLVGNAYYWEGETYYIRRDYVNAADNFRKGFESLPDGPKAPDNLLKLAMSLNALNRDKESCLVLQQIVSKFKKTSPSVTDRADQEQKRIGCRK